MHSLPGPLIISLTSYPPRFPTLAPTLKSLLSQTVRPDKTVLWIADTDYHLLPRNVLALQQHGLSIETCEDLRSYTKLVPALQRYPDHFIATADDDILFERDWLATMVDAFRDSGEVICRRAHRVNLDAEGLPRPYTEWDWEITTTESSRRVFPTGVAGVLYPPGIFDGRVTDSSLFQALSPTADDLWFYWMALLNGATFRRIGEAGPLMIFPRSQTTTLASVNDDVATGNNAQVGKLSDALGFPPLDRIES